MAKITISDISSSGFAATTAINSRFQQVEDELNDKVLYRDPPEGEPNNMEADLDLDSHNLLNVANLQVQTINGMSSGVLTDAAVLVAAVASAEAAQTAAEAAQTGAENAETGALAAQTAAELAQAAAEAAAGAVTDTVITPGDAGRPLVVKGTEDGYEVAQLTTTGIADDAVTAAKLSADTTSKERQLLRLSGAGALEYTPNLMAGVGHYGMHIQAPGGAINDQFAVLVGAAVADDFSGIVDMSRDATVRAAALGDNKILKTIATTFVEHGPAPYTFTTGCRAPGVALTTYTTYHIFAVSKEDGTVDIMADTDAAGSNVAAAMPGYSFTKKAHIGIIRTNASSSIGLVRERTGWRQYRREFDCYFNGSSWDLPSGWLSNNISTGRWRITHSIGHNAFYPIISQGPDVYYGTAQALSFNNETFDIFFGTFSATPAANASYDAPRAHVRVVLVDESYSDDFNSRASP